MQNRTVGIIATIVTALICGCLGLFSCIVGGMIAIGTPFNTEFNGQTSQQTFPAVYGYGMLCLSVLLILIPIAVGFFTLRKKSESSDVQGFNEPMPPAS